MPQITGTELTFAYTPCSISDTIFVDSINYQFTTESFTRVEYDYDKLRTAPTETGQVPIIVSMLGGIPAQIVVGCGDITPRILSPNSSNVDNIHRRFNIRRYTIRGLTNTESATDNLYTIVNYHKQLLAKFQEHLAKGSLNIAYETLIEMQSEDFSYLTTTDLTVSGPALGDFSPEQNMLITDLVFDITHEIPNGMGGSTIYRSFSMTLENRTITANSYAS